MSIHEEDPATVEAFERLMDHHTTNGNGAAPHVDEYAQLTDVGNALRLVRQHGDAIRWVPQWGTWLTWDGRRWRRDVLGTVVEKAKAVARSLWDEVNAAPDAEERKKVVKWALASEGASHIEAMVKLTRSVPGIGVEVDDLDSDPWLLNLATGTVDLRTGRVGAHDRRHLITKLAPVPYDADAECPRWLSFLEQVLPDPDVRGFMQEIVGYSLTGLTTEQVLTFCHGGGANGKSTLLETLLAMMGEYGKVAEPDLLLARDQAHPTGIADLQGARLVVSSEIEHGRRLAEAVVKQLTGSDRIKARFMRADYFEYTPTHKILVAANHKPVIRGTDLAIWRRLRLVPFTVTIDRADQDRHLVERLRSELPGILLWALEGCARWREKGLSEPGAVVVATAGYREEMDLVGGFLSETCVVDPRAWVSAADLYSAYQHWCDDNGERPMSQKLLGGQLVERGFDRRKAGAENRWHWYGVGLLGGPPNPSDPSDPRSLFDAHTHTRGRGTETKGRMGSMGSGSRADLR